MGRVAVWVLGAAVLGCGLLVGAPVPAQNKPAKQAVVGFAGLKSLVPTDWHEDRLVEKDTYKRYQLDAIGDSKYNAHVTLGRVDMTEDNSVANVVKAWRSQFSPGDANTPAAVTKVDIRKIGNLEFISVDITGIYTGYDEPGVGYPDYRLIGICKQGPDGIYSARLVGPTETVGLYRRGFEAWIQELK